MHMGCLFIYLGFLYFFSSISYNFQCKSFTSFVRCFLRYSIFLDAIANGIDNFLFGLLIASIQRIAIDFYMLILEPATWLNLLALIAFLQILWDFLRVGLCLLQIDSFTFTLDSFNFFFLPNCCGQNLQCNVEQQE